MMGAWSIAVDFLFPIPLVFLVLLSLPLPRSWSSVIRKYVIALVDKVLFYPLFGTLNLYMIATLLSSILFLLTCWDVIRLSDKLDISKDVASYYKLSPTGEKLLCTKWRSERNFWISLFSLVLWLILYRIVRLTKELESVKSALRDIQKTD